MKWNLRVNYRRGVYTAGGTGVDGWREQAGNLAGSPVGPRVQRVPVRRRPWGFSREQVKDRGVIIWKSLPECASCLACG